jgi:hypothetical protein
MTTFYLQPYSHTEGAYLDLARVYDTSDLDDAIEAAIGGRFEEYSVELIDGDREDVDLWSSITFRKGHTYSALDMFVTIRDEVDEYLIPGVAYALERTARNIAEATAYADGGMLREGTIKDVAYELWEDGSVKIDDYFDAESYGRDQEINQSLPSDAYDEDGELVWTDRELKKWASNVDPSTIDNASYYVDWDTLDRDLSHEYDEFQFGGTTYTIFTAQ